EGGRLRLRIDDDLVAADVSWPLDEIPGLSGRYFAGTFKIRLAIDDGASTVAIEEGVSATGRRLSRSLRRRLGLRLEAALHRRFEAELRSIESLDVRQGRIWIRWISP
ncbi:MAG: hypothetical protein JXA90_13375, partial [Planctomycetes bacterium]|nr:hypothetical protein [Planctomycetota bacterium]